MCIKQLVSPIDLGSTQFSYNIHWDFYLLLYTLLLHYLFFGYSGLVASDVSGHVYMWVVGTNSKLLSHYYVY